MNPQTSHPSESSVSGASRDILKLSCPFCRGVLNMRRIHLGIEGACVHCAKPVMAVEDEAGCRLVSSEEIPEAPLFSSADSGIQSNAPDQLEVSTPASLHQNPPAPVSQVTPVTPAESSKSSWGFPEKKKNDATLNETDQVEQVQSEIAPEISFSEPAGNSEFSEAVEELPFQSRAPEPELFQEPESSIPDPAGSFVAPPPLPEQAGPTRDAAEWFASSNSEPFQNDSQRIDSASPTPGEQTPPPFPTIETPPPLDDFAQEATPSPPPLVPESPVEKVASPPPLGEQGPFSATGGSDHTDALERQPLPGGISPFSTGSAKRVEPGFAEALFTESPGPQSGFAPTSQPEPPAPEMSPPGDAAFHAANQWGPPATSITSDGVELDFSAAVSPAKAETPVAEAPTATPFRLPVKRKSRFSFLKKILKCFLTIGVIGGIIFAAQTFVPQDKWAEWKQQAIDWLEPGTVILEKLPFGKNRKEPPVAPANPGPVKKTESAPQTRQQISEELLQIPPRQPGG